MLACISVGSLCFRQSEFPLSFCGSAKKANCNYVYALHQSYQSVFLYCVPVLCTVDKVSPSRKNTCCKQESSGKLLVCM